MHAENRELRRQLALADEATMLANANGEDMLQELEASQQQLALVDRAHAKTARERDRALELVQQLQRELASMRIPDAKQMQLQAFGTTIGMQHA